MVDYNNNTTITTSPAIIVKVSYLERRKYFIDALEFFMKKKVVGAHTMSDFAVLKSRLYGLYYEIKESLNRYLDKKKREELEELLKSKEKEEDIIKAFDIMNNWFDEKRLTRIDNIKPYDSTNVETENLEKGV